MAIYETSADHRSTTANGYRRALMAACRYANAVHDKFDAEYMAIVLAHPAMEVFGDHLLRSDDPGVAFCIRITVRNYRQSAKAGKLL